MTLSSELVEHIADARLSAHLATTVEDRPHVAPVWYLYEDGQLLVMTGGRKVDNVRENGRVAVSIERADESGVEWTATILGTASVVDDPDRAREVDRRLARKYAGFPGSPDEGGTSPSGYSLLVIDIGSGSLRTY
jgi:nitroimidazol reductase NimA-like FMN-containing flavoprotein (pyridoxamine 5'-phosphate oxidase superfamily)